LLVLYDSDESVDPDQMTLVASVFRTTAWPLRRERQRHSQETTFRSSITPLSD